MLWSSSDLRTEVVFDRAGIARLRDGGIIAQHPWGRVRNLEIKVPYASPGAVKAVSAWNLVSPKFAVFSAAAVEFSFTARFEVVRWSLAPHTTYDWRLQFILDDVLRLLRDDFSWLGTPGLLDDVVGRVAPRLRSHARLLLYTDLFGLDRFVGGHGAFDRDIRSLLSQHYSR